MEVLRDSDSLSKHVMKQNWNFTGKGDSKNNYLVWGGGMYEYILELHILQ